MQGAGRWAPAGGHKSAPCSTRRGRRAAVEPGAGVLVGATQATAHKKRPCGKAMRRGHAGKRWCAGAAGARVWAWAVAFGEGDGGRLRTSWRETGHGCGGKRGTDMAGTEHGTGVVGQCGHRKPNCPGRARVWHGRSWQGGWVCFMCGCSAQARTLFLALTSAPLSTKQLTAAGRLYLAARCSGVSPCAAAAVIGRHMGGRGLVEATHVRGGDAAARACGREGVARAGSCGMTAGR
jgi:hypothetical protein